MLTSENQCGCHQNGLKLITDISSGSYEFKQMITGSGCQQWKWPAEEHSALELDRDEETWVDECGCEIPRSVEESSALPVGSGIPGKLTTS